MPCTCPARALELHAYLLRLRGCLLSAGIKEICSERVHVVASDMVHEVKAAGTFPAERQARHTAFHGADLECSAATTLQSIWRGRAARLAAQQRIQAAIKLQVSWMVPCVGHCACTLT